MVDSRLRIPPPRLLETFIEVKAPEDGEEPIIKRFYPDDFEEKEATLKQVPRFCYPCETDSPGVQYFTFVLTDIDGKFRFGFCRYPPHAPTCICLISYLPWYEMYYVVLNHIQDLELKGSKDFVHLLLDRLIEQPIPDPGSQFTIEINHDEETKTFKYDVPDTTKLPSIPASRNLTEYFAAITPEIMIQIFVSMLFERRILITSKRLSLLTAVVHGSVSLLYPMQWQHIYVPVLPPHLIDYCCAPMPFLVGVHSSMMKCVEMMPLDEVVIVDADANKIEYPFDDMEVFPQDVYNRLLGKIKKTERALEEYVATQFLRALVSLIGGYRDALVFKDNEDGGSIVFQESLFLDSRPTNMRSFLEFVLTLQLFQQFIAGRLDMLNEGIGFADVFEQELAEQSANHSKHKTQYQQWMNKMKKGSGAFKKTVGERFSYLKGKASDVELKDKLKVIYRGAKSGVKTGYKGVKHYLKPKDAVDGEETNGSRSNPSSPRLRNRIRTSPVKRQSSMPTVQALSVKDKFVRHTMYSTLPPEKIKHSQTKSEAAPKPRTPPPRPPPPSRTSTAASIRKSQSNDALEKRASVVVNVPEYYTSSTPPLAEKDFDENIPFDMLLDIDTICLEESKLEEPQGIPNEGVSNPAFSPFDDSFCVIGDELDSLESPKDSRYYIHPVMPPRPDLIPSKQTETGHERPCKIETNHAPASVPDLMSFDRNSESEKFVLISPGKEEAELSLADILEPCQVPKQNYDIGPSPLRPLDPIFPNSGLFQETMQCVSPETRSFWCSDVNGPDVTRHDTRSAQSDDKSKNVDLLGDLSPHKAKPPLPPKPANLSSPTNSSISKDPFEDLIVQTKNNIQEKSSSLKNIKH